ncbi:hypothetical protein GPA22_03830 [Aromatoleum toluvorans]|uniref:DUF2393 domain-containing protein n=1 Tax=Aromatoleum toluvorans TaxID=92002 RepID=A0ABX1PWH5_9RHOO|nr:hypothetical protein [Aromatoleum toluvorans]NMG42866.1 hypothetical protein [Aromatoleum toluvorans]
MAWLLGIAVLVLLVVSSGFRKFALGLVALTVAGGGLLYIQSELEQSRSLSRIAISELAFENVALKPEYSGYKLSGRIMNNSTNYTLKQVKLVVTMQDCTGATGSQNCITIGESSEYLYLGIPPVQARDFEEPVYFAGRGLNPKGHLQWSYSVSEIRGE